MRTFKPAEADLPELQKSAARLKTANRLFGVAKRESEAAKKHLSDWLREKRDLDIAVLPIGEFVSLEGVALIEIGKQNRFDEDAFVLAQPETYEQFKKDFPVRKFKPLV